MLILEEKAELYDIIEDNGLIDLYTLRDIVDEDSISETIRNYVKGL